MSCDHQLITDHLVDLLDGRLDSDTQRRCEAAIEQCSVCRDTALRAQDFSRLASEWQTESVPKWHRMSFLTRPTARQNHWLSWSAIAVSCVAILLVVFRLEIDTNNGLTISFGGDREEQRIESLITAKLESYRSERDREITAQLVNFSDNQNLANRLLLSEWLEKNRSEWRQDLELLTTSWENQRFRDQQQTQQQLTHIARNQIESDQVVNDLLQQVGFRGGNPL